MSYRWLPHSEGPAQQSRVPLRNSMQLLFCTGKGVAAVGRMECALSAVSVGWFPNRMRRRCAGSTLVALLPYVD